MARSLVYIGVRLGHIFFGLILLGIAGYLLSDFKKMSKQVSVLSSAGDAFNFSGTSPTDYSGYSPGSSGGSSGYSSGSSGSSSGYSSTSSIDPYTIDPNQLATQQAQDQMMEQAETAESVNIKKRANRSRRKTSLKSHMSYNVPLGMVISSSVFTLLTAGASIALMFLWPSWVLLALKFLIGWDIFLAILWLASAGTTGKYLSQFSGWKDDFKQAHLLKALFALSFLMMLSFIGFALFTFFMVRGGMHSANAEETGQPETGNAKAGNPDASTVAPFVPEASGAQMMEETKQPPPPIYAPTMDNQQQQQQQQMPIKYYAQEPAPPNHPPPPKFHELQSQHQAPYEPAVSPQTIGYEHRPYSPTISPPPPGSHQLPA